MRHRSYISSGPRQLHYYTQTITSQLPAIISWIEPALPHRLTMPLFRFAQIDHPAAASRCFLVPSLSRQQRMPVVPPQATIFYTYFILSCSSLHLSTTLLQLISFQGVGQLSVEVRIQMGSEVVFQAASQKQTFDRFLCPESLSHSKGLRLRWL